MVETVISDDLVHSRWELRAEGTLASVLTYERRGHLLALLHAETDPARQGQGLAGALVAHVLDEAREHRELVLPYCSYVRDFIAERPDAYLDLVPADRRADFGLPG